MPTAETTATTSTKPELGSSQTDAAWDAVRTWSEMRAEAKLAWWYVWRLAKRRPDTVWVSFCELGHDQGTGERSGRRAVRTLMDKRLVEIRDELPGRVSVYVREPREVISPPRDRTGDNERPLLAQLDRLDPNVPPRDAGGSPESFAGAAAAQPAPANVAAQTAPADVAQHPPAVVAQQPPSGSPLLRTRESALALELEAFNHLKPSFLPSTLPSKAPGSADVAQQPPSGLAGEARPIGEVAAERMERWLKLLPGQADRRIAIRQVMQRLGVFRGLNDAPKWRIAKAVVYGELPQDELDSILMAFEKLVNARALRGPDWWYAIGAFRKAFARHGVAWGQDGDNTGSKK